MYPEDSRERWYRGQGHWSGVAEADWRDWRWQMRNRLTTLEQLEERMELTRDEREGCLFARNKLSLAITPYFFNLMDLEDPECPIRRQVVPRSGEQVESPEELVDPVGEEGSMGVAGLVHRYPDRCLFLVTNVCAAYCRYCTRSRLVSNAQGYDFHPNFENAIRYIEAHTEIRDVLLSGGDPLMLSDKKLDYLLGRLRAIKHVEFIRIGSRIPVFMPQRVTPGLQDVFRKHGPVWMSIHANHPRECTEELYEAAEKLTMAGVPLGNQSVLLKGVNDDPAVMTSLVHRLLMMRVRPYYLYQCDLITGSRHLRADVSKGIEIIKALRGHSTGYAVPQFVIDAPGGGGKIPINPEYVQEVNDREIVMRNFEGKEYRYPLMDGVLMDAEGAGVPEFEEVLV